MFPSKDRVTLTEVPRNDAKCQLPEELLLKEVLQHKPVPQDPVVTTTAPTGLRLQTTRDRQVPVQVHLQDPAVVVEETNIITTIFS